MSDYKAIIDRNGPLSDAQPVSAEVFNDLQGVVPPLVIDIWRNQGVGTWVNGLFRMCVPSDFEGLLSQVFHADPDFSHRDCHIFGYTAFGMIFAWSERHGLLDIDLARHQIAAPGLTKEGKPGATPNAVTTFLFRLSKSESLDAYDDQGNKLFSKAVKKHGRPSAGEAFAFVPTRALGGAPTLGNIKRVPALEHFLFLAQLQQFQLIDYLAVPPRIVRAIG